MRTVKIDYSLVNPKVSYDGSAIGIQGEHRATELVIIPPLDMPSELEYRLAFDPGGMSDTLSLTDGELRYELPQSITRHEVVSMNIEGYEGAARIYKSVMVELYFDEAVDTDSPVDADGHSIGAEVAENTAARHTHSNKDILDKFGETNGSPTYNGEPIGGGSVGDITAEDVSYTNAALPNISTVGGALDELVPKSHTHANKDTLDKLSVSNGKLQYNGSDVGLKGDKGDTGATGAPGLKGDTGADGKDGKDGVNGITPTIGANGNWYLGTTDTGKPSRGEKGDTGAKGDKGDKGDPFTYSDFTAEQLAALKGARGDKGDKGDKGEKGDTGADGYTPVKGTDYWTAADKQEIIDDIHSAFYIDLAGTYPDYTCPVAMDDIKAAYNSGYNLVCRCQVAGWTTTLPLFIPMSAANTWIFSGSGALQNMGFAAQSFTVAITSNGVVAEQTQLSNEPLSITVGDETYSYNGSEQVNVVIDDGTEVSY